MSLLLSALATAVLCVAVTILRPLVADVLTPRAGEDRLR